MSEPRFILSNESGCPKQGGICLKCYFKVTSQELNSDSVKHVIVFKNVSLKAAIYWRFPLLFVIGSVAMF